MEANDLKHALCQLQQLCGVQISVVLVRNTQYVGLAPVDKGDVKPSMLLETRDYGRHCNGNEPPGSGKCFGMLGRDLPTKPSVQITESISRLQIKDQIVKGRGENSHWCHCCGGHGMLLGIGDSRLGAGWPG